MPREAPAQEPQADELVTVRLMLPFLPDSSDAQWYVGREKGFYEEEGIDLEILPGESSRVSVTTVAVGAAEIGIADLTALILAKNEDPSLDIKSVATLYARPPYTVVSLKDGANIARPEDLDGATVHLSASSTNDELMSVWAEREGISGLKFANTDPAQQGQLLLAGRIPSVLDFSTDIPEFETAAGKIDKEIVALDLAEHGMDDLYSNSLVVSQAWADENPDVVRGFIAATVKALSYSFEDPESAADVMAAEFPEIPRESVTGVLEVLEKIVTNDGQVQRIGEIDPSKVESTLSYIRSGLEVGEDISAEDLYTTEYLD